MINRRIFLGAASLTALAGCSVIPRRDYQPLPLLPQPAVATMPAIYGPLPTEQFPLPAVPPGIVAEQFWRRTVVYPFPAVAPGTIIVDPMNFHLYVTQPAGIATRYGVGIGRQGFAWSGEATIQLKRKWPRWKAPDSMIARRPDLEPYSVQNGGMAPGPDNPLGARALYLFQDGVDTLYRIHGTPDPGSIGRAVSSGCIRMLNHDIIHLYDRVAEGARVMVLKANIPPQLA